jgi:hypothetical protein
MVAKGYKITKVIMNFKAVVLSFKDCKEKLLFFSQKYTFIVSFEPIVD